jgi:hypothetical protein
VGGFLLPRLTYQLNVHRFNNHDQDNNDRLKGRIRGMGGWVVGFKEWVDGRVYRMGRWVGLQKLMTVLGRFDTYKGGVKV